MNPAFKGLLTRLQNLAKNEGITVYDLVQRSDYELMRLPNIGRKTVALAREFRGKPVNALWVWAVD